MKTYKIGVQISFDITLHTDEALDEAIARIKREVTSHISNWREVGDTEVAAIDVAENKG